MKNTDLQQTMKKGRDLSADKANISVLKAKSV